MYLLVVSYKIFGIFYFHLLLSDHQVKECPLLDDHLTKAKIKYKNISPGTQPHSYFSE